MAERFRKTRKTLGLTLRAVAHRAGVSLPTVHSVETGRRAGTLDVIERLAVGLGVSPSWLAFGQGPQRWPGRPELRRLRELLVKMEGAATEDARQSAEAIRLGYNLSATEPAASETD